jgi:D-3-phosphoglycerate dehydrogenase
MRRVKSILVEPEGQRSRWGQAIVDLVGEAHDLAIYDYGRPIPEQFSDREAIIDLGGEHLTPEMLDAAPNVKLWQMVTVGYDQVDLSHARSKSIPIAHCPGSTSSIGLAEMAMAFMLMLSKRYLEAQPNLREGEYYSLTPYELHDAVLGLVGFGASGIETARRAKPFGMKIMIVEPRPIPQDVLDEIQPIYVGGPDQLDKLMSESNYVSLHLTLNEHTRGIIDARRIGLMKPSACLINIARGDLVDEAALHQALLDGKIGGIGTDVFAGRSAEASKRMLDHPRYVATPHISGGSTSAFRRRAEVALENVNRVAEGLGPNYRVD